MASPSEILDWLILAFEQSTGNITESFYFDKRYNEFFSIIAFDYFMLDEHMNRSTDVTTNYSKSQENSLIDRIKRIENDDPDIISIPRLSLEDRKIFMQQFVDTLTDQNLIRVLNQRIQNQDYRTKFDFYFGDEADDSIRQKWEDTKNIFLHQRVDTFLNLNNINIENSTLWVVDSTGSISVDLTHEKKKPWWKFW